jgi:hypothetical protein
MRLGCKLEGRNPYAAAPKGIQQGFLRHMGDSDFFADLVAKGARVDVERWLVRWQAENRAYVASKKRFWLYN